MKRYLIPALTLACLTGCPTLQPFQVDGLPSASPSGDQPASAAAVPSATAAAAATAAAPATGAASPSTKPSAKPSATASADAAATKTPTPAPSAAPAVATKTLERPEFLFKYPTTWKLDRDEKNPTIVHLTSAGGVGTFEIKQVQNFQSLETERKSAVSEVGAGLVSNDATKLDLVSGYTVVGNVTTSAGSRFTGLRGYVYRYNLWRITSVVDRKASSSAAVLKDIDGMLASWLWQ